MLAATRLTRRISSDMRLTQSHRRDASSTGLVARRATCLHVCNTHCNMVNFGLVCAPELSPSVAMSQSDAAQPSSALRQTREPLAEASARCASNFWLRPSVDRAKLLPDASLVVYKGPRFSTETTVRIASCVFLDVPG